MRGKHKSEEQRNVLESIQLLYNACKVTLKFFNDFYLIHSGSKYKSFYGKERPGMLQCATKISSHSSPSELSSRLKILTSMQMLTRLPAALAQVKTGNTSENLLNEIRQMIYSLHWTKKINKNVEDNIMNSMKL